MNHPRLTKAGRLRLQEQLETLRGDSRREALERVKTARKFCDFREDVTYADEGRPDVVAFGSRVVIRELPDGNDETYRLVGELEADLAEGTISVSSPLGSGLMGGVVGQSVSIASPGGPLDFEIVQIEA